MKILKLFFVLLLALFQFSCTSDYANNSLPDDKVVVQAYLYSNKDVQELQLNYTFPVNSRDTTGLPVENAAVNVYVNETLRPFFYDSETPGRYFSPQSFFELKAGDPLRLEIVHQKKVITAVSVMPPPPVNLMLSRSDMRFPNKDISDLSYEELNGLPQIVIDVTWDQENLGQHYYFAEVKNVDSQPAHLKVRGSGSASTPGIYSTNLKSINGFSLGYQDITHTGMHVVYVYRVNQEYADLYGSLFDQNSRGISAPATNIKNGLGIFTGFTCISDTFYVVQK